MFRRFDFLGWDRCFQMEIEFVNIHKKQSV